MKIQHEKFEFHGITEAARSSRALRDHHVMRMSDSPEEMHAAFVDRDALRA